MTKAELMKEYEEVKGVAFNITLVIHMPTGEKEVITNPNVEEKISYIDKTYNDELVHSGCSEIYIESVKFGKANNPFTFGTVLHYLPLGYKFARKGWNGKGMYIYMTEGSIVQFDELKPHIDMKADDNSITIGWTPSQVDMLAKDWYIVE